MNSVVEETISLTFLPTGEIENSPASMQNLEAANTLLAESISLIRRYTGIPILDIWHLINWFVVSYYWILLADFGQTAPAYYDYSLLQLPDFNYPIPYTSINNIFVNDTLFTIYSTYLRDVIFPCLREREAGILLLPEFLPLDDNNTLAPTSRSFLRSYSCVARQLKGVISVAILIVIADYTFIAGGYSLLLWAVGSWAKYKSSEGEPPGSP
jgi:hypothetical protein